MNLSTPANQILQRGRAATHQHGLYSRPRSLALAIYAPGDLYVGSIDFDHINLKKG
jgi:hypothetical protein